MTGDKIFGQLGEEAVCKYLKTHGYVVAARNYKTRSGEIDIVAVNREVVAFVEVKTRKRSDLSTPKEAVNAYKQERIISAASIYTMRTNWGLDVRFDVAEVIVDDGINGQTAEINYIENAFTAEDSMWI